MITGRVAMARHSGPGLHSNYIRICYARPLGLAHRAVFNYTTYYGRVTGAGPSGLPEISGVLVGRCFYWWVSSHSAWTPQGCTLRSYTQILHAVEPGPTHPACTYSAVEPGPTHPACTSLRAADPLGPAEAEAGRHPYA